MVSEVDEKSLVKVIDFGLAKATGQQLTNQSLVTAYGQVLGTPAYMSPEQADLTRQDIDTRTDIYSLGVLLYELLAGVAPFDFDEIAKGGYTEVIRTIREVEPPPISQRVKETNSRSQTIADSRSLNQSSLTQLLRGDLEIIVSKAMAKERGRRYQTPRDLADDIERYLSSEAILARPASLTYRLKKSVQRNKAAFAALTVIAATVIAGTGVSVWQAVRATLAERDSAAQLVLTRKALDSMSSLVIDELLTQQADVTDSMRKVLSDSVGLYEQLASLTGNDRDTRESIAAANFRIAEIHRKLGIEELGIERFAAAADNYLSLVADFPDELLYATRLANAYRELALSELENGDPDAAASRCHQSELAIEDLKNRFGKITEYYEAKAYLFYTLGSIHEEQNKRDDALEASARAIQSQKELIDHYISAGIPHRQATGLLASMIQQWGLSLRRMGDIEPARSAYREAIEVLEGLQTEAPLNSNSQLRLGVLLNDLGVTFLMGRELEKAESLYRKSLAVRLNAVDQFPNDIDHLACLGCSQLNMGNVLRLQNQPESSLPFYADASETLERVRERNPKYSWGLGLLEATYRCRAESHIALEQFDDALADIEHLNEVFRGRYPDDKLPIRNIVRRAYILAHLGRSEETIRILDKLESEVGQNHRVTGEFSYFAASTVAALAKHNPELYDVDDAVRLLGVAIEHEFSFCEVRDLPFHEDPDFASLRDHPDYEKLRQLDESNRMRANEQVQSP